MKKIPGNRWTPNENLKHKTILMLIYSGGLRIGESIRLRKEDIQFDRKSILSRAEKVKKTATRFYLKR